MTAAVATLVLVAPSAAHATARTDLTDPSSFGGGLGSAMSNLAVGADSAFGLVSPQSVGSLLDSSFSLAELDPVSGALMGGDVTTAMTGDYAMTADLANSSLMALDTADLARRSLEQAEAARRAQQGSRSQLAPGAAPAPYDTLIPAAVAQYCPALTAPLLAAQIEAESNFNAAATSSAGAAGPAQFMPGTWAQEGIDGDGDGRADIRNPADAVASAASYDCKLLAAVSDVAGDPTANMLAAYNAGLGNVRKYNGIPPFAETQNYVAKILRRAEEMSTAGAAGQGSVGPDGCPASAPANTLREGSTGIGIATLCANSVAQAPTPEAARAIKYQLNNLGVAYSQPNRMKDGYYDCSSLAMRSYTAGGLNLLENGWAPNTTAIRSSRWAERITLAQALPGDLVFPKPGHVSTALSDGYMVHTNRPGDVSHVKRLYDEAFYVVRVDPARV